VSQLDVGLWPVRVQAEPLAVKLQQAVGGVVYRPWLSPTSQKEQFAASYRAHRSWILIMATGIAVRFISGLPEDKRTDPSVVVIDEAGRFAISLLGGHEGGANALAYKVSKVVSSTPVVTTATEAIKPLVLGIGCRKGASADAIEQEVLRALQNRSMNEVREVATIDLKADEPGLLEFCKRHELPLRVFTRQQVAARAYVTQESAWVQKNIGLPGVCEPCALLASPRGRLIVSKQTGSGVAVALVEDELELKS
jgi:cobalt-precorrin 5A hydrolase